MINRGDETLLLETTGRTKDRMLKKLNQAKSEYIPFASVDTELRKKVYLGIIHWISVLSKKK